MYRNLAIKNRTQVIPRIPKNHYDIVVIGGGITGTAISREVKQKYPLSKILLVEKEKQLAKHQSSHNSGVIHAGIYYRPNSLKANLCLEGLHMLYDYCESKKIPYNKCGKLVVATDREEVKKLDKLYKTGIENNVPGLQMLSSDKEIQSFEPNCRGIKAIWSPSTGNVDFQLVTKHLGDDFLKSGGEIKFNYKVETIEESNDPNCPIIINKQDQDFLQAKYVVKCGGLHSDKLTNLTSTLNDWKILSFRVDYKMLDPPKDDLVRTNIYAVPNLPFLGAHFSPKMGGGVLLGPSAVPAFTREGYEAEKIDLTYIRDTLSYSGFQKMVTTNISECMAQIARTVCSNVQARELKKLVPFIGKQNISVGPTAVQAQAIDLKGRFLDDFVIDIFEGTGINKRIIDCKFVPSPGATSSLAISRMIVNKMRLEDRSLNYQH